ncbi:major facilitator superfamily domain-containing protein 2B-like isoform X1 [Chiloscyllium plagiosum]|uniref:major facilitator superfamily domain-containing protein 2B-like isoform X1 n=1 Tax=Chiloscyllium plagiosum TaxID=36176 RepID=UPI001CB83AA9|nr:major facilitator superfamily domain-containing protein 2B-like isoform X1 [Chiloscyllium plagiosum]XP_043532945.1 major facilitator superfamily domain-containing protein 2B-like isoform X1 [Chiloscyllium plagiosum]
MGEESASFESIFINQPTAETNPKLEKDEETSKLTICNKLSFGIGGVPYEMVRSILGFFLQLFLLDVAQISPFHTSFILFFGRVCDAVTDPAIGCLICKSKRTKIGRLMPWIIGSAPFAVLSYFLLWYVPPFGRGRFLWYIFFYGLFSTLLTCYQVPYSTLTMFLSCDLKERNKATVFRMTMQAIGTVVGVAVQGQIVAENHISHHCFERNMSSYFIVNSTGISKLFNGNTSNQHTLESILEMRELYIIASGAVGSIYLFCMIILLVGVRERDDPYTKKSEKPIPFLKGTKLVLRYSPYLKLTASFLFISMAIKVLEGNFALFCTYAANLQYHYQNIVLVILVTAVMIVPFWQFFLQRFGKKIAVYLGTIWLIPFLFLMASLPNNLIVAYVAGASSGLSFASFFLLPWSMLPDVIDAFRLEKPQIKGLETIFCSFYVFFTKLANGVSMGLSALSLHFAGYKTGACVQPQSVAFTLKLLVAALPVGLIIIGLIIFRFYPITEDIRMRNELALEELRQNVHIGGQSLKNVENAS